MEHSTLIIISKQPPEDIIQVRCPRDCIEQRKIFALHLTRSHQNSDLVQIEWYFICPYCNKVVQSVIYNRNVKKLTLISLRKEWRTDVNFAVVAEGGFIHASICEQGQFNLPHLAPPSKECPQCDIQHLTIALILNISFVQVPLHKYPHHKWGGFLKHFALRDIYRRLKLYSSFKYEGTHAIYCNFNVWSENSDSAVWVIFYRGVAHLLSHYRGHTSITNFQEFASTSKN